MSFSRVPEEVWSKVGKDNLKNVSARSSLEISAICNKSEKHCQAILAIADKIGKGFGEKRIKKLVADIIENKESKDSSDFEYKFSNKGISFSKSVVENDKYLDFKNDLKKLFEEYFK